MVRTEFDVYGTQKQAVYSFQSFGTDPLASKTIDYYN